MGRLIKNKLFLFLTCSILDSIIILLLFHFFINGMEINIENMMIIWMFMCIAYLIMMYILTKIFYRTYKEDECEEYEEEFEDYEYYRENKNGKE